MLGDRKEDTVQIPMESCKPVQPPRAHDPRWVQRWTSNDQPVRLRAKLFTFQFISMYVCLVRPWWCPVQLTCCDLPPGPHTTHNHIPYLLSVLILLSLSLLLRCDPSDINISDEMSKTTVWKSLNSNQKDIRPVAAKKARLYPLFLTPVIWEILPRHTVVLWCFAPNVGQPSFAVWPVNSGFFMFSLLQDWRDHIHRRVKDAHSHSGLSGVTWLWFWTTAHGDSAASTVSFFSTLRNKSEWFLQATCQYTVQSI